MTAPTLFTFALEANTPVRLRPTPDLVVGFVPLFADKRLHPIGLLTPETELEIGSALEGTNRAYVVDSLVARGPVAAKNWADLATLIASDGFKRHSQFKIGDARISVWQREGTESPSG
jgi:hypothetical protein